MTSTIAQSENNSQLQRSPALCAAKISFRLNIFGGLMPCVAPGGAFGGQIIFQVNVFLAFALHLLCVFALPAFVSSAKPQNSARVTHQHRILYRVPETLISSWPTNIRLSQMILVLSKALRSQPLKPRSMGSTN